MAGVYDRGTLELIGIGNYIAVNRTMIRVLGLHAAVMIGELADKARMFDRSGSVEDGWFYVSGETLCENTGLGERAQRTAISDLVEAGILEVRYGGLPKRRWFRIDVSALMAVMSGLDPIRMQTDDDNDGMPVTEAQVTEVLTYLSQVTGASYSTGRSGNRCHIRARLREGYTVDDCKKVIDKKTRSWAGTRYARNLNPQTLFGKDKFDIYLNQPEETDDARHSEDGDWDRGW